MIGALPGVHEEVGPTKSVIDPPHREDIISISWSVWIQIAEHKSTHGTVFCICIPAVITLFFVIPDVDQIVVVHAH